MKKILDVGCGTGNLLNYLAKKDKRSLFFGIDIEKDMVNRAYKGRFCNRESFFLGDGKRIPFKDNFFDEVYCHEVLEHVVDLDGVLLEIKRVLKNKGLFHVTVPLEKSESILIKYNPDYPKQVGHLRFFSKEKIKKVLTEKKFAIKYHKSFNSIEHFFWKKVFNNGGKIINQLGEIDKRPPKWVRVISLAFSSELPYQRGITKNKNYKFIMGFFFIFYPLTFLIDLIFTNKKQKILSINLKNN